MANNIFKFSRALDPKFITGFSMGIYGAGGVGKTSIVKMLPPEETMYIAIDDSSHPIRESNFYYAQLTKPSKSNPKQFVKDLNEIYEELHSNKNCPIRYLVIDSISELERYFQTMSIMSRNASRNKVDIGDTVAAQKDYGDASMLAYKYLVQFRDMKTPSNNACGKAINTIFIANEMSEVTSQTTDQSTVKIMPFLTKKLSAKFRDAVDILGYISASGNGERQLTLSPSSQIEAKNRYKTIGSMKVDYNFNIIERFINPIKQEIANVFGLGNKVQK